MVNIYPKEENEIFYQCVIKSVQWKDPQDFSRVMLLSSPRLQSEVKYEDLLNNRNDIEFIAGSRSTGTRSNMVFWAPPVDIENDKTYYIEYTSAQTECIT